MLTKKFLLLFLMVVILVIITACSNNYVSTNLDKVNFNQYFSASKVKIYHSEKDINARYQFISGVEGQDCQIKPHHAAPNEINARTQARRQAFDQHANGVVFSGCAVLAQEQLAQQSNSNDAQQCHAIVICYAKAYAIETKSSAND
ncbi:MAG: rcsF protein [Colwellia sp.]|nr:rcsF protein [Colwellia sp.]